MTINAQTTISYACSSKSKGPTDFWVVRISYISLKYSYVSDNFHLQIRTFFAEKTGKWKFLTTLHRLIHKTVHLALLIKKSKTVITNELENFF